MHPNLPEMSEEEESHSFTYFSIICLFIVGLYVGYHNKQKVKTNSIKNRFKKHYTYDSNDYIIEIHRF